MIKKILGLVLFCASACWAQMPMGGVTVNASGGGSPASFSASSSCMATAGTGTCTITGLSIPSGDIIGVAGGGGGTLTASDSNLDTPHCGGSVNEPANNINSNLCLLKAGATISTVTCLMQFGGDGTICLIAWYTPGSLAVTLDVSLGADNPNATNWSSNIAVASFTGTSGTLTFTTVSQALVSGQSVTLTGFSGGNTGLNGQVVSVSATGLTATAFEATVTGSGYSSGAGLVTTGTLSGSIDLVISSWCTASNTSATSTYSDSSTQRVRVSDGTGVCALADRNVTGTSAVSASGTFTPTGMYAAVTLLAVK